MLKATALMAVVIATMLGQTSVAQAHYIKPAMPVKQMTLQHQVGFWEYVSKHYSYVCKQSTHAKIRRSHCEAWKWSARKQVKAQRAYLISLLPPHHREWKCIHKYEGAWNDDGAPYYGGLQMDLSFQQAYGAELLARKGTANNWTPLEQMWVAERAYRSGRGFYPWPNTARYCGLI